jgi:NAD(P)-dependent dehydrogenase (short-subunit alcohol dehydrogenase family)
VSSTKDLESFYAQVKERFGRIDILFANAGIAASMPFAATSEELLKQVLDINVKGVFYTVQKALPLLSKGSSVILTTSIVNQLGMAGTSAYAASKAAVRAFVRVFAAELVDQGIRVNAVSPGPTETPILGRSGLSAEQVTQVKDHLENVIPMKRMGTSEEVAKAVLFFASDDSSFTTGEELMVDGGMTQF